MPNRITDYFAITLRSKQEAAAFSLQALTGPLGIQKMGGPLRPVVLQMTLLDDDAGAYVSVGAAQLLKAEGSPYPIASIPTLLSDLPDGLSLVAGDQGDYHDYLTRASSRVK